MTPTEALEAAIMTENGITLTFDRAEALHSYRTRLYRRIQQREKQNEREYMEMLQAGMHDAVIQPTGWENIAIRKTGLNLWIGLESMENFGITNVENGERS